MRPTLIALFAVLGLSFATQAQAPADRAWQILQDGTAHQDAETRVQAVHALGLLVKDDRARKLEEVKSPPSS